MQLRNFLAELEWRGMLHQRTDGLESRLDSGPLIAYAGFDPTAPSLHVGHLVPVMGLVHLQRHGHRPIALVGGGTGLIGDPSGRTAERQLNTPEVVAENTRALRVQLERFLDFQGPHAARLLDNASWLAPLRAIDFMRDVGKHFTLNYMLAKESVRSRLDGGISYTEFSYMLLQAYDYLELHRREGATLQIGGSDQWGNITAGAELIRRSEGAGAEADGVTMPLVTTAAGVKFGKTESGAVWLDPDLTSPYRFYQFWINMDDRDVGRYLRYFSLRTRHEIEELDAETATHPERRGAQHALAGDLTSRVHGAEALRAAAEVTALLFGSADPSTLSAAALEALRREVPFAEVRASSQPGAGDREAIDVVDLFTAVSLVPSRGAGRRLLEQGGVYVNGRRVPASERLLGEEHLLPGGFVLLRKGARDYALVRIRSL